mmetsp:Transcript_98333/g.305877  ORF Transcript_98333/g.305877 Transcript_98333/m.305877 type:complete len:200 (+) Transcript_98333:1164-1763(+)
MHESSDSKPCTCLTSCRASARAASAPMRKRAFSTLMRLELCNHCMSRNWACNVLASWRAASSSLPWEQAKAASAVRCGCSPCSRRASQGHACGRRALPASAALAATPSATVGCRSVAGGPWDPGTREAGCLQARASCSSKQPISSCRASLSSASSSWRLRFSSASRFSMWPARPSATPGSSTQASQLTSAISSTCPRRT